MKYEYNGYLTFDERCDMVAREIIDKYSDISYKDAYMIAGFEDKIDTPKSFEMEFNRLYNILLFMRDNEKVYNTVLKDLIDIYYKNIRFVDDKNRLEDKIMDEILLYDTDGRDTFPLISEFY